MPRDVVVQARRERWSALIDAMVLSASADGSVSQAEKEALLTRVTERPEFDGLTAPELTHLIADSAVRLSTAQGLEPVMKSLRTRLPDHRNRLLAFGLAAAIAFADRRATREELGLLKTLQAALGISEEEVERVITAVEAKAHLAVALGEPPERLYAEAMVIASVADGMLSRSEATTIVETLAGDPVFRSVGPEDAKTLIRDSLQALQEYGLPLRLQVLARGLTTHPQRLKAFSLAARVADAPGRLARGPTATLLDLLQATFGLADDEVARARAGS